MADGSSSEIHWVMMTTQPSRDVGGRWREPGEKPDIWKEGSLDPQRSWSVEALGGEGGWALRCSWSSERLKLP